MVVEILTSINIIKSKNNKNSKIRLDRMHIIYSSMDSGLFTQHRVIR